MQNLHFTDLVILVNLLILVSLMVLVNLVFWWFWSIWSFWWNWWFWQIWWFWKLWWFWRSLGIWWIIKFGQNCKKMSRSISHLLCYIKCLHLEAADVANSASKSQLLLFHCKVCSLLVCLNFILVQKKWDNTSKGWEEVGELEETLTFFVKFD